MSEFEKIKIDLSNSNKLTRLLGKDLYKDKYSFIREVISNAVDSHKKKGTDKSIIISNNQNTFSVRDYGVSLTQDEFKTFIGQLLKSNKEGDVNAIGEYGIGTIAFSKYIPECTYTCYKDRKGFVGTLKENFDNSLNIKVGELFDTDEEDGVLFKIEQAVPTDQIISKTLYFPNIAIADITSYTHYYISKEIIETDNFTIVDLKENKTIYDKENTFNISIDNVNYKRLHQFITTLEDVNLVKVPNLSTLVFNIERLFITDKPVCLNFNKNEGIRPSLTREEIQLDENVPLLIVNRLFKTLKDFLIYFKNNYEKIEINSLEDLTKTIEFNSLNFNIDNITKIVNVINKYNLFNFPNFTEDSFNKLIREFIYVPENLSDEQIKMLNEIKDFVEFIKSYKINLSDKIKDCIIKYLKRNLKSHTTSIIDEYLDDNISITAVRNSFGKIIKIKPKDKYSYNISLENSHKYVLLNKNKKLLASEVINNIVTKNEYFTNSSMFLLKYFSKEDYILLINKFKLSYEKKKLIVRRLKKELKSILATEHKLFSVNSGNLLDSTNSLLTLNEIFKENNFISETKNELIVDLKDFYNNIIREEDYKPKVKRKVSILEDDEIICSLNSKRHTFNNTKFNISELLNRHTYMIVFNSLNDDECLYEIYKENLVKKRTNENCDIIKVNNKNFNKLKPFIKKYPKKFKTMQDMLKHKDFRKAFSSGKFISKYLKILPATNYYNGIEKLNSLINFLENKKIVSEEFLKELKEINLLTTNANFYEDPLIKGISEEYNLVDPLIEHQINTYGEKLLILGAIMALKKDNTVCESIMNKTINSLLVYNRIPKYVEPVIVEEIKIEEGIELKNPENSEKINLVMTEN